MMDKPESVLLVSGSPKCERSNSRAIGKFLVEKLEEKGLKSEEAFTFRLANASGGMEKMLAMVDRADIIVVATPLYVDSLPSFTIKTMEVICEYCKNTPKKGDKILVAAMSSGFPEREHMEIALSIVHNFATEAGFQWGGQISLGMGEALSGKQLAEGNGMTGRLTEGISLAADALANGEPIPEEANKLMAKPLMPVFLAKAMMLLFGRFIWKSQVKDGSKGGMQARPYEIHN